MYQSLVERAAKFAATAHKNHFRKYTDEPYVVHLMGVAFMVHAVGGTDEMVAAALLHDVVEDTPTTHADVLAEFGYVVAGYVEWLTDVSKPSDGNRATRKMIDREHMRNAPPEAQTIKLADMIDNSDTILKYDPDFSRVYIKEKALLLPLLKEGNPLLLARAHEIVDEYMGVPA
jgi:(p)ppGpp synthase/HD superfamily hydrolase